MPQLRITITAPLPDEPLAAFRERHEIEGAVLEMLETLHVEDRDISVTCEIEADASTPGGLTQVRKRTRGPNKARATANGAEAAQGAAIDVP